MQTATGRPLFHTGSKWRTHKKSKELLNLNVPVRQLESVNTGPAAVSILADLIPLCLDSRRWKNILQLTVLMASAPQPAAQEEDILGVAAVTGLGLQQAAVGGGAGNSDYGTTRPQSLNPPRAPGYYQRGRVGNGQDQVPRTSLSPSPFVLIGPSPADDSIPQHS